MYYINSQNQSLANLNDQSSDSMVRELLSSYEKYRPDLAIKPLLQYCAGKLSLQRAMSDYGANRSHEREFAKEVDRITSKYEYGAAPCGHEDQAYGGEG